ncbi:regulating synaptic membrane exocytosis protein 2 [Tachysurus ichikawai]
MPRSPSDSNRWRYQERHLDGQIDDRELQRQLEEEYRSRYRSDPNLARYPVKPQPYEEQMRIHAQVSRARHERRHSDVSLAFTELDDAHNGFDSQRPASKRSYSMDRSSPALRTFSKMHHLDPGMMDGVMRTDSLSSDQSESMRPARSRRTGRFRAAGSFSSSEEEINTTPEYTSCEDVELECESFGEKGSQRISDSEFSDYDCEDGVGVILDYRHNGRKFQSSTLSVPEQVMSSNHRSRSDVMRNRSRSPSVPPPHSRSLDHGVRGPAHYGHRNRLSEDQYSPDRTSVSHPHQIRTRYHTIDTPFQDHRRMKRDRRLSVYSDSYESPERHYNGPDHIPSPWPNHLTNGSSEDYREDHIPEFPVSHEAFEEDFRFARATLDRHYRSRSADQRPMMERHFYTRSRSSERPEPSYMRSMPSLPSRRSAPPSPALTRANPRAGSVQTSPSSTPASARRGRQLPQVPPKGSMDRNGGEGVAEPYEGTAPPPAPPPSVPEIEEKPVAPPPVNGRKEVTWEDQQKKVTGMKCIMGPAV